LGIVGLCASNNNEKENLILPEAAAVVGIIIGLSHRSSVGEKFLIVNMSELRQLVLSMIGEVD